MKQPLAMCALGTLVAGVACGRLDFAPLALADAPPAVDATGSGGCSAFGPWSEPIALTAANSSATDYGGQVTADGLAVYFDSDRDGTQDLFVTRRASRTAPFGAPTKITELSTADGEDDITVSPDELDVVFRRSTTSSLCLYEATRADATQPWSPPVRQDAMCTSESPSGPYLTADKLTLYYSTASDGLGEGVIEVTRRTSTSVPFASGGPVAGIGTNPPRGYPALTADETTIYFEEEVGSARTLELYQATRPDATAPFGAESAVFASGDSGDGSITADGRELFFASQAAGSTDLYEVMRGCQ